MCTCLNYCNYAQKININNLIKLCKKEDTEKEQHDPDNFIDFCFVIMQHQTDNSECFLCLKPLNLESLKIYKVDNNQGFIKSNSFLICNNH